MWRMTVKVRDVSSSTWRKQSWIHHWSMQHTRAPNTKLGAAPLWTSAFGQANKMQGFHHTSQHLKLLRDGLHVLQQYGQQSVDPGGWRLSLASLALITVLVVSKWIWFHIKRDIHACHIYQHDLERNHWIIYLYFKHALSLSRILSCDLMHPPLGERLHLSAMRDAMLLCPQNVHGDSCAGNLSVLICKTESAQSHSHSSGTYENLFCAHRGTLLSCSFRSLFDLLILIPCLSKAYYSQDLEGHLMSFWLQSAQVLCFSLFLYWHGRNDMEWYSLRYPQCFLRESWELPPHVSKESPLSKHCRIASDCSLRFQLKTKHWSLRLW